MLCAKCAPLLLQREACHAVNLPVSPSINGVTLDFRTIACNSGYIMVGQSTSTCQTSGLWTQVPSCTRELTYELIDICRSIYHRHLIVFHTPNGTDEAVVACPTNAAGAPACTCNSGYAGSLTFSGGVWAGTCSRMLYSSLRRCFTDIR